MATRIEVNLPNDEEGWIDVSNKVRNAAVDYAIENNVPPSEGFEEIVGLNADLLENGTDEEAEEED